jgi:Zn/Cd-binding protein ZinT
MEETLKIKFKLHALEYEVEGQQEAAKEEFKNFNKNILTHILSKVNIIQSTQILTYPESSSGNVKQLSESTIVTPKEEKISPGYPTLRDVKLRDLPKTETEWLLIYAYYASGFGAKEFTKDDILKLYEDSERKTDNRIANLSNNIKRNVTALLYKSINDATCTFIILPEGKKKAVEILEGKSTTKQYLKRAGNKNERTRANTNDNDKKVKTNSDSVPFFDLKFNLTEMNSLKDFFKSKSIKTQNDKVAIVLLWFQNNKNESGGTLEEVNYLIKISTKTTPLVLGQVLINMKGSKLNLIEKNKEGRYKLTSLGLLHADKLSQKK